MVKLRNNKYLYLVPVLYFVLAFINIHFALLMMVCMSIPMGIILLTKKSHYCNGYCPRVSYFSKISKGTDRKLPKWFSHQDFRRYVFYYFMLNLFILIFSTYKVATGMYMMDYPRLLFFIKLPALYQLIPMHVSDWLMHLSYRFFSMMMTTTLIGSILAIFYKPRTWCIVCPITSFNKLVNNKF